MKINTPSTSNNFIEYEADRTVLNTLYPKLITVSDDRDKMTGLAIDFIEGNEPFEGQGVNNIDELNGKISQFNMLELELLENTPNNLEDLKKAINYSLGLNEWGKVNEYIKSQEYYSEKDRVWQNQFSLTIIAGYKTTLLKDLDRTLIMCNLIERIVYSTEGENLFSTPYEIVRALNATIILPKDVFPLPAY